MYTTPCQMTCDRSCDAIPRANCCASQRYIVLLGQKPDLLYHLLMRNIILTIIGSLVISACVVDSAADRNGPESSPTDSAVIEQAQVQIPPELRSDPSAAACQLSNTDFFNDGVCFVSIVCHDDRAGCFPSFCTNGRCNGAAPAIASGLCSRACSPGTNCGAGNFRQVCP